MVKSTLKIADYRKVLRYQNILRIAQLVRAILTKHPKATEAELKAIFEQDYQEDLITEGIRRAKCYVSIPKKF